MHHRIGDANALDGRDVETLARSVTVLGRPSRRVAYGDGVREHTEVPALVVRVSPNPLRPDPILGVPDTNVTAPGGHPFPEGADDVLWLSVEQRFEGCLNVAIPNGATPRMASVNQATDIEEGASIGLDNVKPSGRNEDPKSTTATCEISISLLIQRVRDP